VSAGRFPPLADQATGIIGLTSGQILSGSSSGAILQESALAWNTTTKSLSVTGTVTKVSAAGSAWDTFTIPASTLTLSGGVGVTEVGLIRVLTPTITSSSATTVSDASTLTLTAAPTAGGSVTLTRAYSLWSKAGATRFDGGLMCVGGTSIAAAQLEVVTSTDTTNGAPSSYDNKFFTVGEAGATGGKVFLSYRSSSTTGFIGCLTPGTGFRTLFIQTGGGTLLVGGATTTLGFFAGAGTAKATVSGAKGANAALGSLMTALAGYGLVTDSTTA